MSADELEAIISEVEEAWRPRFLRQLAELRLRQDDFENAANCALAAASRESSPVYRAEQLAFGGLALCKMKRWNEAEVALLNAQEQLGKVPGMRRRLGALRRLSHYVGYFLWMALSEQGRVDKGLVYLLEALRTGRASEARELSLELGQAYFDLGRYQEAARCFRLAQGVAGYQEVSGRWLAATESVMRKDELR